MMSMESVPFVDLRLTIDNTAHSYNHDVPTSKQSETGQPGAAIPEDTEPGEDSLTDLGDPSATDLGDQSFTELRDTAGELGVTEGQDDQSVSGKISRTSSKDETRSTGKDTQRSKSQTSVSSKKSGGTSKQSNKTVKSKKESEADQPVYQSKEYAEVAVQDEGGDPDAATVSFHQLDMVREDTGDFSNAYDLNDEQSWGNVPKEHMLGRFIQYRKLTRKRLGELEDQLATTVTKTQKKVETLKSQFKDHKSKWEAERSVLVQQIEQAIKLQSEAENEADTAMSQLEDFIIEQEKLENLEDQKHEELSRQTTKLAEEAQAQVAAQTMTPEQTRETPSGRKSTAKGDNAEATPEVTSHPEREDVEQKSMVRQRSGTSEADQAKGQTDGRPDSALPNSAAKEGEPELTKLLQQTDDAKVQELKRSATTLATTPTIETPKDEGSQRSQSAQPTANEARNLSGMTNEDIRAMSSKSRASLRSQYKTRLGETKLAVEDRRSKSPAISIPSLHSLDDDQLIDDEEFDLPVMDDHKDGSRLGTAEKGTSPPQTPRKPSLTPTPAPVIQHTPPRVLSRVPSAIKGDHPIVQEYLETYDGVMSFKDDLTRLLIDKDMMTASQVLSDLESVLFDHSDEVEPQLRKMTTNLHFILDELRTLLGTVLINEREPVVSSLVNLSRDQTQTNLVTREKSDDSGQGLTRTNTRSRSALSQQSDKCLSCQNETVKDLRETCTLLQNQLDAQAKKHEEQMRQSTVLMMRMQETIKELQKELAELTKEKELAAQEPPPEPSIMFTRLDSERNAKTMKRALYEDRLHTDKYKEAVSQMDQYVNLPVQRLGQLVRRYMHHKRMKQIEDNVRHSKSLNENVFEILDKMEDLQNKRAKEWTDNMDALGVERYRLASLLMETFDNIEQESGIFLIKPIYSFKGRDFRNKYEGKLSRMNRPTRESSPARDGCRSAMAPAPTPATNTRPGTRTSYHGKVNHTQSETALFARHAQFEPTTGVSGLGMVWNVGQPRPVWNLNNSQAKELSVDNLTSYANQNYNTPRILELDINRMLIGQNNVSTRMRAGLTEDRLVNATNNSVRSYVTVNRPTVAPGQSRFAAEGTVPPSTPHRPSSAGNRRKIPSSPPLPPIHVRQGSAGRLVEGRSSFGNINGSEQEPATISAL